MLHRAVELDLLGPAREGLVLEVEAFLDMGAHFTECGHDALGELSQPGIVHHQNARRFESLPRFAAELPAVITADKAGIECERAGLARGHRPFHREGRDHAAVTLGGLADRERTLLGGLLGQVVGKVSLLVEELGVLCADVLEIARRIARDARCGHVPEHEFNLDTVSRGIASAEGTRHHDRRSLEPSVEHGARLRILTNRRLDGQPRRPEWRASDRGSRTRTPLSQRREQFIAKRSNLRLGESADSRETLAIRWELNDERHQRGLIEQSGRRLSKPLCQTTSHHTQVVEKILLVIVKLMPLGVPRTAPCLCRCEALEPPARGLERCFRDAARTRQRTGGGEFLDHARSFRCRKAPQDTEHSARVQPRVDDPRRRLAGNDFGQHASIAACRRRALDQDACQFAVSGPTYRSVADITRPAVAPRVGLAEVLNESAVATRGRIGSEREQVIEQVQLLALDRRRQRRVVDRCGAAADEESPRITILIRIKEQVTLGRQTVASCTSGLLLKGLDGLGCVRVHHAAHVAAIDAHPERNGRHDHLKVLIDEGVLNIMTFRGIEPGVVGTGDDPSPRQLRGEDLGIRAFEAVHDGGSTRAPEPRPQDIGDLFHRGRSPRLRVGPKLAAGAVVLLGCPPHDVVSQVRPVKGSNQDRRVAQSQLLDDVTLHLGRRGRRECMDACAWKGLSQTSQLPVLGDEVMAPLADAVRFIDDDGGKPRAVQHLPETWRGHALGGDVQQVELAAPAAMLDAPEFIRIDVAVHRRGGVPAGGQPIDLVLHERNQWRDDDAQSLHGRRGQLEAQALAAAGGEDHQRVPALENGADGVILAGAQGGVPPESFQAGVDLTSGVDWPLLRGHHRACSDL